MKFCSNCGAPVTLRVPPGDSLPRHVCDACHAIHYQNPRMIVGCIPEWEDRILLCRRGIEPRQVHVANSAALAAGEALAEAMPAEVNAVRPGLMLYGVGAAPHLADKAALRPVMTVCTRVANVRWVRRGDPVGYGATFRAKQRGRIATLPIGYADGIPWSLGNRGFVLLRGRRVPIAGRVSMDLITLDVGSAPVEIGDPVVVFGQAPGGAALRVEEVAEAAGTIPYELLVRVGARVTRVLE